MTRRIAKRIEKPLTSEERARVRRAYEETEANKEQLIAAARKRMRQSVVRRETCRLLRAEREAQGLSLADMQSRTGITRAALCRLENDQQPNPQIATLQRYAAALGKEIHVTPADAG